MSIRIYGKIPKFKYFLVDTLGNILLDSVMTHTRKITEQEFRQSLIDRAERYAEMNKTSLSAMSKEAVNDSKFMWRVKNFDLGFNVKTYERMSEWLDGREKAQA